MARKKITLIGGGQIGGNLALLAAQKELGDISEQAPSIEKIKSANKKAFLAIKEKIASMN